VGIETLTHVGPGTSFVVATLVLLAADELGFRLGRRRPDREDEFTRSQAVSLQAATLGLLALLLGFTFSIALQRYDARRELVVAEANAIGTAWLRASLLPTEIQPEMRRLLQDYADLRLRSFSGVIDQDAAARLERESRHFHDQMWSRVSAAAVQDTHSEAAALLVQATNAVIDLHTARMAGRRAQVPSLVILLLGLVAFVSMMWVGFSHGLGSTRRAGGEVVLVILIASSLAAILDLDRPSRGLVRVSQEPMRALLEGMRTAPP